MAETDERSHVPGLASQSVTVGLCKTNNKRQGEPGMLVSQLTSSQERNCTARYSAHESPSSLGA